MKEKLAARAASPIQASGFFSYVLSQCGGIAMFLFLIICAMCGSGQEVGAQNSFECGIIVKQELTPEQHPAYYDRFGNEYTEDEVSLSFYPNAQRLSCSSGYFALSFVGDWTDNEKNTACQVFGDLSGLLIATNPDDMPPINILLKKEALSSSYAGLGTPFFEANCGVVDSRILYHLNNAYEDNYALQFLGTIQINSNLSWHTVAEDTGTFEVPNITGNKLDLYTVMLHEALHVLGFLSRITPTGASLDNFYSRWDKYLFSVPEDAALLIPEENEACCNYYGFNAAVFDNMPLDFANGCGLRLAFRNNAGTNIAAVNIADYTSFGGANREGIFLNKLSHLDHNCQDELGFIVPKAVMHPGVDYNEARRIITESEKNILCSIGYHLNAMTNCEQACELFTNPDEYIVFLSEGNTITISVDGADGLLSNDVHSEDVTVSFDTECSYMGNLVVDNIVAGSSISLTAATEGIYHFCYTVESCNDICRTEEVTIIVKQEPLPTHCDASYCNIVCFGDFEEFDTTLPDNYFNQLDIPPFRFTEAANSPDVQQLDDNNTLHLGRCHNCDIESIAVPLSEPIPPGCEVVVSYNAIAILMYWGNNPGIIPALQFTALSDYPCSDFSYFNCTPGIFNVCGGTTAANMTPDVCGQAIDFQTTPGTQFPSAIDAINFNNLANQSFTWVNTTGQDITTLLITANNTIGDYSEAESIQYFLDNLIVTLQCEEQIDISAADQEDVCTDSYVYIPYEVCLQNADSPPTEPIIIFLDAGIEGIAGVSVLPGGDFNGNGQAEVNLTAANSCITITLALYIGNNFETGDHINIPLEAFNNGGYCIDGNGSGMDVMLEIIDCGYTPPELNCLDAINYFTVLPGDEGIVAIEQFGVSRPSYMANSAEWTPLSHPFISQTASNPIYFNTDLVVPAGTNLTINNLYLYFAPDRRILVQPGGSLVLNNCTIDGVCQMMWQGIQVEGPGNNILPNTLNSGKLNLVGGEIRNAIIGATTMNLAQLNTFAIAVFDWTTDNDYSNTSSLTMPILWTLPARNTAGGRLSTANTHFINCFQGLNFSWNNTANYEVKAAQFLKDATNLWFPFTTLSPRPEAGVSALWINRLSVTGCTFHDLKYGIRANDANFASATNNTFNRNTIGISVRQILSLVAQGTSIKSNQFENCQLAVQADGIDYNKMSDNTVNLLGNSQTAYTGENLSLGFYLRGTNSIIKNNFIHRTDFGMVFNQSDVEGTLVAGNLVNNSEEAILIEGNNESAQFKCNHLLDYNDCGLELRSFNGFNGVLPQQGECVDPSVVILQPAANSFIATLDVGAVDIRLSPNTETLEYHDVGTTALTVDDNSAIGNFEPENCDPSINLNAYCSFLGLTSLNDVDNYVGIGAMQDKILARKVLNLVADSNYTAAIALLHQYNSSLLAKRRLVPHKIGMDSLALARNILEQINIDSEENLRYKQLYSLLIDLKETNRSIHDINPAEQSLLTDIANSSTKTSYKAQAILYLARGIEFPVVLPALSNGTGNWHTVFKTDTNGKVSTLYPNPAQNTIHFEHQLSTEQKGKLLIYDLVGKEIMQHTFVGNGQQELSVAQLPAGMYLYVMKIDETIVQKSQLVLIP